MRQRSPIHLRVFLSSSGDVSEERRLVTEILEQFQKKPYAQGKVTIEVVAWDDPNAPTPMAANETPQELVNRFRGRPSECDLTIVILWGHLGTKLPPNVLRADGSCYESGTVWEYEDAMQAGKPVWVYRRTEKQRIAVNDPEFKVKRQQYQAIKDFLAQFQNSNGSIKGGINDYEKLQNFKDLFERHFENFVRQHLEAEGIRNTIEQPGLRPLDVEHGDDVFISYAREDISVAQALARRFTAENWRVFWDRSIPIGRTWDSVLEEKLDRVTSVVVLWSKASISSEWVLLEAQEAADHAKLIPIFIQDVKPPLRFRRIQGAQLIGWNYEADTPDLLRAIQAIHCLIKSGGHAF